MIFGSAYLPFVLPLVLPPKYLATSAGSVLGAWVYLIPWLSLNGSLEAFLSSAAGAGEVRRQSKSVFFSFALRPRMIVMLMHIRRWMFAFSVVYISTAVFLYRLGWGDVSLIYANCVNLSARVAYCLAFAVQFFDTPPSSPATSSQPAPNTAARSKFSVKRSLPPLPFLVASAASAVLIRVSASRLNVASALANGGKYVVLQRNVLTHVAVGAGLGLMCVGVWWGTSGRKVVQSVRGGRVKAE